MTSESGRDGPLGNPADHTLVDAIQLVGRVETIGGKHNRVSLEHQAWRPIIATPLIEGEIQFSFLASGSLLASKGGSLLVSAEVTLNEPSLFGATFPRILVIIVPRAMLVFSPRC